MKLPSGILVGADALEARTLTGQSSTEPTSAPVLHWRLWWALVPAATIWVLALLTTTDRAELAELSGSAELRQSYAQLVATLGSEPALLLPGLALGYTDEVPSALIVSMRDSGLSHLTAVSGVNCVIPIVAGALLGRLLGLQWRQRIGLQLACLVLFVWMVWPQATILRAGLMLGTLLFARLSGRGASGMPILSLTVMCTLIWQPALARDLSFTMSVLATLGLATLAPQWSSKLRRFLPSWMAEAVAVTASAITACSPALILMDATISGSAVLANLIAGPAALVASALGTVAAATLWCPPVSALLSSLAIPATWIVATQSRWWSEHQIATLSWPSGLVGAVAAGLIVLLALVSLVVVRKTSALLRTSAILLVPGVVLVHSIVGISRSATIPENWSVVMCDVGQGDGMLISAGDTIAMSDVGPEPKLAKRCLQELGITKINLLVVSHFDADHIAGLSGVLATAQVETAIYPDVSDNRPGARAALQMLKSSGVELHAVSAGMHGSIGGSDTSAQWQAWWPRAKTDTNGDSSVTSELNESGLVLHWELPGGCSLAALADLGSESQLQLMQSAREVDIVKVAHHGSKYFSNSLVQRLHAKVALIGVGKNDYGHPTAEALSAWNSLGAEVGRTDTDGDVAVSCVGGKPVLTR